MVQEDLQRSGLSVEECEDTDSRIRWHLLIEIDALHDRHPT